MQRNLYELNRTLRAMSLKKTDAVLITGDLFLMNNRTKIAKAILNAGLPAMYPNRTYHEDGALMSYGPDLIEVGRKLAGYVDRILKGAKPDD
jgi:putative tryptophan/tyrosine transport system substrate-binding protein